MSGTDEQRAIMDAELYWFGGQLGAPKVYDTTGSNFHAPPTLRDSSHGTDHVASGSPLEGGRQIHVFKNASGRWDVEIDEA